MKYILHPYTKIAGLIVFGLFIGYLLFGRAERVDPHAGHAHTSTSESTVWTCSMHPQIRQNEPGKCPLCGMDLIPAVSGAGDEHEFRMVMTDAAVKLAQVQTELVRKSASEHQIQVTGRIEADERRIWPVTASAGGRIIREMVGFTGETVKKGDVLAHMESPELITAQQEYITALGFPDGRSMADGAVAKLRLWGMSEDQISRIAASRRADRQVEIVAPVGGYVSRREIRTGDWVETGAMMFEIINLDTVWAVFNVFESDLGWVKEGGLVKFQSQTGGIPETDGRVAFVDRLVDDQRRTIAVRADVRNTGGLYRPGMLLRGSLSGASVEEVLLVGSGAVLWTGTRSVAYIQIPGEEKPTFEIREIELAGRAGDDYIILSGLNPGELVVSNGAFRIDAEFQLRGKPSMMERGGIGTPGPHQELNTRSDRNLETGNIGAARGRDITKPVKWAEPIRRADVPKLRSELAAILQAYYPVKDALLLSDGQAAFRAAVGLRTAIRQASAIQADSVWLEVLTILAEEADLWVENRDLAVQRERFFVVSHLLGILVHNLGVTGTVFVQYCPMVNDNSGAVWLSRSEEIENPYLPESMYGCGEILHSYTP